jgi:hypothetical protein
MEFRRFHRKALRVGELLWRKLGEISRLSSTIRALNSLAGLKSGLLAGSNGSTRAICSTGTKASPTPCPANRRDDAMLLHRQRLSSMLQNRNKTLMGLLSDKAQACASADRREGHSYTSQGQMDRKSVIQSSFASPSNRLYQPDPAPGYRPRFNGANISRSRHRSR